MPRGLEPDARHRSRWLLARSLLTAAALLLAAIGAGLAQDRGLEVIPRVEAPANEPRVALVMGNGAYASAPLANPHRDAADVAQALRDLGFEVELVLDADWRAMREAMIDFGRRLEQKRGVGLFYYSGHGVQVNGTNYLIPIGAAIDDPAHVEVEAVELDQVLARMGGARSRLNIVILDACRNNPFRTRFRTVSRGLAQALAPAGTFLAYATAPGDVAADGDGRNSPFTAALLDALRHPGLSLEQVFKRVSLTVQTVTEGRQVPWISSSIVGEFVFRPPEEEAPAAGAGPAAMGLDVIVWNAIRDSREPRDFSTFLDSYPDSPLAPFARNRLAALGPVAGGAALGPAAVEPPSDGGSSTPAADAESPEGGEAAAREDPPVDIAVGVFPRTPGGERAFRPGEIFDDGCEGCPELVVIPGGRFEMGSPADEVGRENHEGPRRGVEIERPFALGRHEVTFAQWDACVAAGGCVDAGPVDDAGFGRGAQPVINVTAADAEAYLAWLGERTGHVYRLPSEAEWEYAARAGTTTRYPWGDGIGDGRANCDGCAEGGRSSPRRPLPVGGFEPNAFGLHDMAGNVWEWTADCWNDGYADAPATAVARSEGQCDQRVVRGGSWMSRPHALRSANRDWAFAGEASVTRGFRVLRELPESLAVETPPGPAPAAQASPPQG